MRVKKSFVFLQLSFPFFIENGGSRNSVRSARLSFQSIIVVLHCLLVYSTIFLDISKQDKDKA